MLPELLKKIAEIEGIEWIRILYVYPEEITDELISEMANEKKIVKYLDLPIQHASDKILKAMGRRTSHAELTALISRLRKDIPGIVLRTSIITGFPGETDADFEELLDFIREERFDRLGAFTYSREENTAADKMKNQIPAKVKKARRDEVMRLQQVIAFEKAGKTVGKKFEVIIEGYLPNEETYVCRSYMDAPGVDGYVFVQGEPGKISGEIIKVKITAAKGYDLIGKEI